MIDLSHLTEEEQGVIMTVLRRDADLKKAEEERVRKLDKILNTGSQSDSKKYLTGEWFYEAKSRRHMDKIHGSEIILASMKPRKAGLDSPRSDRSKTPSSQGSDIVAPPKPARCLETLQPQENDAEKENLNSAVRSPRTPRHNPFNRASLVVEPAENNIDTASSPHPGTSETEPISPLKSLAAAESSQASGGSVTSEGSSVGFRPVPKKRTFLSRQTKTENNGPVSDSQVRSPGIVPAPRRRSIQLGFSGSSNQSNQKSIEEMPPKSEDSDQVFNSTQPSKSLDGNSQQPLSNISQVSSSSRLERERHTPSLKREASLDNSSDPENEKKLSYPSAEIQNLLDSNKATLVKSDASSDRNIPQESTKQVEHAVNKHVGNIQDTDQENCSSVGTSTREGELSLPQSTADADPPVLYDLIFIDKSGLKTQAKPNHNDTFKLSTQATSPTGDEEDSIAKVLDWFNRSTDSNDWLNTDDGPEVKKSSNKHVEARKIGGKDDGEIVSDQRKDTVEIKSSPVQRRTHKDEELRVRDRKGTKEVTKTKEVPKEETREKMRQSRDEDNNGESQSPQISHLKSFWEKNNSGPKILISNSNKPGEKAQKPEEKNREKMNKTVSDIPCVPGIHKFAPNHVDERKEELIISPQEGPGDKDNLINSQEGDSMEIDTLRKMSHHDLTYNSTDRKLEANPQVADRRGSDPEILSVTRLSPRKSIDFILSPESEANSLVKPIPQLDGIFQPKEIQKKDELSKTVPEDVKSKDSENDAMQSSESPKRMQTTPNKERLNSPHSNRQGLPPQEITAIRIKQLRSFWEQERNKPMFKPKVLGEGKVARGANQAKLNKRFTKSEFDLRSIGNEFSSDDEDCKINSPNFTVLPLNQRLEKSSPSLGTSRTQFKTLREFWDEATLDVKGSIPSEKPKSPKRKEPISPQKTSQELKCGDSEINRASEFVKTKPGAKKVSSPKNRPKSPHDKQMGTKAVNDSKNIYSQNSKDTERKTNREEKSTKPLNSSGKEPRFPKSRKDSFSNSSSRGNSMRRATSMFALSVDKKDQIQLKMDVSPVHSQSRKPRLNTEEGGMSRRSPVDNESLAPRARAYVPTDYRHYLGMTDKTNVHTTLVPNLKDEGSEGKCEYEFDLDGPMRASTPVSSDERYSRRGSKTSHRPLWATYSSDTGQDSSVSSRSETWSISRNSSSRENDDENLNLVRKALRRAEARPKNLAKSMEDITGSLSPRQEKRQDPSDRRISDVSSMPSPSSSIYSDPEHLKKMSKSVPSFLQKEDVGADTDFNYENHIHRGSLMSGNSFTNLTSSSGRASLSSSLSGSVMTMCSADFGNVEVQGNIQFSINYVQKIREFHIFVAECSNLAAVDPKRGRSDPYVKSYLAPDKANLGKRKTSVKKKSLNPTFNEILRYRVRMEYLRTQTLILSVWHNDTFGRNSFLGEVDVDLSKWNFDHTHMNYLPLKGRTTPTLAPSNGWGEMKLAIRFLPQIIHSAGFVKESQNTGEIHIWVKECKNLPLTRTTIDPYVKCCVLPDTSRKSRQKTRVLRRTVNPVFNHTMVYDGIREADLAEACVELTVWDRDRLASNLLGGLRLGPGTGRSYGALVDWMDSASYEVALWDRMKASPNEWVEAVLPLRMLNSAKLSNK
uniref:Synaptotagmin-like protein 2 n=1 Tax=Labrus bergylta TaxID=56723 RepID=A0A3Q3GKB5_9LABR|nr:synaptotagmin-like protein 2 isoform X1 [Labrus bergylta]